MLEAFHLKDWKSISAPVESLLKYAPLCRNHILAKLIPRGDPGQNRASARRSGEPAGIVALLLSTSSVYFLLM
jgi:uncharacterized protein (DUF2336 family)